MHNLNSAFTVLEIMISVAIIGSLLIIAIPTFKQIRETSASSILYNNSKKFSESISTYILNEGELPSNSIGSVLSPLD